MVTAGWVVLAASTGAVVTAVPYVLVDLGWTTPVPLPVADSAHLAAGVLVSAYLAVKIRLVGVRLRVPVAGPVALWQRWLSATLGIVVAAVAISGAVLLVPLTPPLRADLSQVHLMLSTWAAGLAVWHVWGHRHRTVGRRSRRGSSRALMHRPLVAVLMAVAVPVVVGSTLPAAVSGPSRAGADAAWVRGGPAGFTDVLLVDRRDNLVLAGGAGLRSAPIPRRRDQRGSAWQWRRLGPFGPVDVVLSLFVQSVASPDRVLVGTADGLFGAPSVTGPYRLLTASVTSVHGIAVDRSGALWCAGLGGIARSTDGGATFTPEVGGLGRPDTAWALRAWRGSVYASDASAVYRWTGGAWTTSTRRSDVVALDDVAGTLTASSMGDGIAVLDDPPGAPDAWRRGDSGLVRHDHGTERGVHVVSVTGVAPGLDVAGTMTQGAAVSADGSSWTPIWPQLGADGVVWRVVAVDGRLLAATDSGVMTTPVPNRGAPATWWWPVVTALVVAGAGTGVAALGPRRRRSVAR